VRKVVGSESGPAVTAVFLAAALQDLWGLLVEHEGFWPLTNNIFTLGAMGLFFMFRKVHPDPSPLVAAARVVREHPSDSKEDVARAIERMTPQ
jgi:hypothetical protein